MKIKNIVLVLAIVIPSLVLASGHEHKEVTLLGSDFLFRVLNFSVFAGLIYYLAANPIKEFFLGRSEGIAKQLEEIDIKLQASKDTRLAAEENLVNAEAKAKEIVVDAGNEAKMLSDNITEKNDATLLQLEKQASEKQALESKKATRATIDALLNDGFANDDITVDEAKVVSLISNKVA